MTERFERICCKVSEHLGQELRRMAARRVIHHNQLFLLAKAAYIQSKAQAELGRLSMHTTCKSSETTHLSFRIPFGDAAWFYEKCVDLKLTTAEMLELIIRSLQEADRSSVKQMKGFTVDESRSCRYG